MPSNHKELADLVIHANHLKVVADEAQRAFREAQDQIVDLMQSYSVPTVSALEEETGLYHTGTLVESEVIEIDQEGLCNSVDAELWEKVTKRVLDPVKLDAHMVTGDLDPKIVNKNTIIKRRKPYIRFTVKQHKLTFL